MIVSNTTPLSSLLKIRKTHLLDALYGTLTIPPEVAVELDQAGPIHDGCRQQLGFVREAEPSVDDPVPSWLHRAGADRLLAMILLCLIGTAAERRGLHEQPRLGRRKHRAYSRLFLARLLLTVEHGTADAADLADAIGPLDQWVASDHAALLAE